MKRTGGCVFEIGKLFLIVLWSGCVCPYAVGQAQAQGQWTTLPYTMPINPVHVSLLHTGKVLVVSGSGNDRPNTNYQAALWDPQLGTISTQALGWDMFCNGMVVLPDGRPFVLGGNLTYDPFHGWLKTSAYDPATGNFVDLHGMAHGRWYPTGTTLGDGRVMVFSGLDENGSTNTAVEIYTVGTGWSLPSTAPFTPALYPRLHLLPNGKVFLSGQGASSKIFDPSAQVWTLNVAKTNYGGFRGYGSSVLLPLTPATNYDPRVMILGGANPATNTTEIIDLGAANPQWKYSVPMSQPRIEMNAVLLPTGKVLALGGSTKDEDAATASLNADLIDPDAGTLSSAGANAYPRLYHSVALLLPDGTVWVAGGNPTRGSYEQRMEIYSPAYLFTTDGTGKTIPATRPTISSVDTEIIGYNSSFQVQTPDAASIASVVLVRAGSVTHAFDMDQRLVGLSFTAGSGVLAVTGPPNGNIAPPGYYLLFILNKAGVPSVAAFIQVSLAPTDRPPTGTITNPASDLTIGAGQSVNFSGAGNDPDGTVSSYSWVFPGGSPASSSVQSPGAVSFSNVGVYTPSLTIKDGSGLNDPSPPTRTITVLPSFSLSSTPASISVGAGGTAGYSLTLTPGSGFTGTVSFSVSGLPAGVTASLNPSTLTTSGSTALSVKTSTSTPAGTYPLKITGSSGQVSSTATVTLVVAISVSPTSITIMRGHSGTYTVTVRAGQGFSGTIALSVSGLPPGTTATFNPTSVTNSGSSRLTVKVNRRAARGTYPFTIKGTSTTASLSTTANLTIQ